MKRSVTRVLWPVFALLLTFCLLPLVLVAGEPLRRYALARRRGRLRARGHLGWQVRRPTFLEFVVTTAPFIALTAPARFVTDRVARPARWVRQHGPWFRRRPPETGGVREPRRPRPGQPGGAVALAEPRTEPIRSRLLGVVAGRDDSGRPGARWRGRPAR
jgi:hypothetical protein